jgi:ankyrin repeat protein
LTLLEKGAEINAVTTSGTTSLMGAAEAGHVEVVRLLMERKADSTLKDKDGKMATDLAVAGKHKAVVQVLKDLGDPAAQSASCLIQ